MFQEKFSFLKKVLLPKILLRLPTVHYGCYLQVSLRCELYTVSTTWLFFAISHLAIIMKSDHDQKQPSSTATPYNCTLWVAKKCWVAELFCEMRIFLGTVQHLLQLLNVKKSFFM